MRTQSMIGLGLGAVLLGGLVWFATKDSSEKALPPKAANDAALDAGLTIDEIEAIRYALINENDPVKLRTFAATLEPDYPTAGSLLRARAALLDTVKNGKPIVGGMPVMGRREAYLRQNMTTIGWSYDSAVRVQIGFSLRIPLVSDAAEAVAETVGDALETITEPLGDLVSSAWDTFGQYTYVTGIPWLAESALKVAQAIERGDFASIGDVMSDMAKRYAGVLKMAAPLVALVPGIGTGIAVALTAASALALGQNLADAALEAAIMAVPGGGVAQVAMRTAVTMGSALAKGERLDRAAMQGFRAGVPEQFRPAFDAGLALAQGKSLQEAGFAALYQFTKGKGLLDRAAHFSEMAIRAAQTGKSVKDLLIDSMKDELGKAAGGLATKAFDTQIQGLKKVTTALVKDERILKLALEDPAVVAASLKTTVAAVQAAASTVVVLDDNVRVVDQKVMDRYDWKEALRRAVWRPVSEAKKQMAIVDAMRDPVVVALEKIKNRPPFESANLNAIKAISSLRPIGKQTLGASAANRPPVHPCDALESAKKSKLSPAIINALTAKCNANPKPPPAPTVAELALQLKSKGRERWVDYYRDLAIAKATDKLYPKTSVLAG